jgi:hypothetical protein
VEQNREARGRYCGRETLITHQTAIDNSGASLVMPSFSTIHLILEGVGAMLAVIGLGGSGFVTLALLLRRPSEEIGRWGQIGTAVGFILGGPVAIVTVLLLSS